MNFSFLAPYALYGLILAGIPVLIHLISVKKAKVLKFPETRFVRLAVTRTQKKLKLLQLLLLLLRMLAIILLVLAFSRVVLNPPKTGAAKKEEPAAVALLLDTSYSMGSLAGGKTAFEEAKDSCLAALKVFREEDRIAFCSFSETVKDGTGLEFDREKLGQKIKLAKLTGMKTSLKAALNFGYTALKESRSANKQIVVFTDAAVHGINFASPSEIKDFDADVKVIVASAGAAGANCGITAVLPAPSLPGMAGFNISAKDFSGKGAPSAEVSLHSGGERKVFGKDDIPAGGTLSKSLFFPVPQDFDLEGYAELSCGDCLKADDRCYFASRVKRKKNVLLIDGDPKLSQFNSETFFLKTALSPEVSKNPGIIPSVAAPAGLLNLDLSAYKVIFLCNVEEISGAAERRLEGFMQEGGNIVFFPGDRVNIKAYSSVSKNIFPAAIGKFSRAENSINPLTAAPDCGLFKRFDVFGLMKPKFYGHLDLIPAAGASVLLAFRDGAPFLIEGGRTSRVPGKALVFSVPADRDLGDFPLKPVFLPFTKALVEYLSGGEDALAGSEIKCGEVFRREPAGGRVKSVSVAGPDNNAVSAEVSDGKVLVKDTEVPGLYRLSIVETGGTRLAEYFAVNVDAASGESAPEKFGSLDLKAVLKAGRVELIKCGPGLPAELEMIVRGREISSLLFLAVLCLLAVEGAVAVRKL